MSIPRNHPILQWAYFGGLNRYDDSLTACDLAWHIVAGLCRFFAIVLAGVLAGAFLLDLILIPLLVLAQTGYIDPSERQAILLLGSIFLAIVIVVVLASVGTYVVESSDGPFRDRMRAAYSSVRDRWCARIEIVTPQSKGN